MSRENAIDDAALFGLGGAALVVVGSVAASVLVVTMGIMTAALPGLVIWCLFAYFGMRYFAKGLYVVVEDAQA